MATDRDQVFIQTCDAYVVRFLFTLSKHLTGGGPPPLCLQANEELSTMEGKAPRGSWGSVVAEAMTGLIKYMDRSGSKS